MRHPQWVRQLGGSPVVLVNPRAGACSRANVARLAATLAVDDRALRTVGRDGSARALAAQAVRDRVPAVIVGGGDGTAHEVIQELAGTATALGIVPLGTSNDLAADLGMPRDLALAFQVLAAGAQVSVDLLRTRSAWIATAGGLGLPARVALRCNELREGHHRWWAGRMGSAIYAAVAAHQICWEPLPSAIYRVDVDGHRVTRAATAFLVSRVPRFGGLRLAEGSLVPRCFWAALISACDRRGLLAALARLRLGLPLGRRGVGPPGVHPARGPARA